MWQYPIFDNQFVFITVIYSHYRLECLSDQLLSCVQLFATLWIAACQASQSIINS